MAWESISKDERFSHILEAMAHQSEMIQTCQGYAHGRSKKNGDPFIWLYAPWEGFNGHVVKVWPDRFRHLPPFIETNPDNWHPMATPTKDNLSKDQAMKTGRFVETPRYVILRYNGRDTPLGPERRFQATLAYELNNAPDPAPAGNTNPKPKKKATPPPAGADDHGDGWVYEFQDGNEVPETYHLLFREYVHNITFAPNDGKDFWGWIKRNLYCLDGSQGDHANDSVRHAHEAFLFYYNRPPRSVEGLEEYSAVKHEEVTKYLLEDSQPESAEAY